MLEADGFLRWNSSAAGLSALRELIVEAGFAGFSRLYAPARIGGFDLLRLGHLDGDLHAQLIAGSAE